MQVNENINVPVPYNNNHKSISGKLIFAIIGLSLLTGTGGGFLGARLYQNQPQNKNEPVNQKVVVSEDSAIIDVVKKASPAVVSIVVSKDLSKVPGFGTNPFGGLDPFSPFFGFGFGNNRGQQQQPGNEQSNIQQVSAGSGFFVTSDGLILTNKHVVSDQGASYTVLTNDHKKYDAKVLAIDPVNDIAILKIDINSAPILELSDSAKLEIGQHVVAIGNSLGQYQNTVTTGVVSGIGRSIVASGGAQGAEQLEGVIQTDAAINPGNSGGPLLNIAGQVIGINTAIDQQGQLVGFAIPAGDAKKSLDSYNKNGKITRAYLGVRYVMISQELANSQTLPKNYGALVSRGQTVSDLAVIPGSPADKAGITENDIILECNNEKLEANKTLHACIKNKSVGDTIALKLYHKGEEKTVQVKLEESK